MIECPYCKNDNYEEIVQHDRSLAGWKDYGRNFTCLKCRKTFFLGVEDIDDEIVMKWPDV